MITIKRVAKLIGKVLLGFVAFVVLYLLSAYILSHISVSKEPDPSSPDVAIYILTNGDHTDIVVPVKNDCIDWTREISYQNTINGRDAKYRVSTAFNYLALGWGDKGFYLHTPTWGQLKFSVAFKAATGLSTSAIHATYYKSMVEGTMCKKITIGKEQYTRLVIYIQNSFKTDSDGHIINIKTNAQYGPDDAFYEAKRRYNIFYTCNTWANNALKACGQKACVWTPFDKGIFYMYR